MLGVRSLQALKENSGIFQPGSSSHVSYDSGTSNFVVRRFEKQILTSHKLTIAKLKYAFVYSVPDLDTHSFIVLLY